MPLNDLFGPGQERTYDTPVRSIQAAGEGTLTVTDGSSVHALKPGDTFEPGDKAGIRILAVDGGRALVTFTPPYDVR